ncbi:MAG: chlororespiratory reduction 6 domain-containing protein [Stellaceae bacterium]
MEAWEHPAARVDNLVLMGARAEVEAGDVSHTMKALNKLLHPDNAKRLKGRLIFGINGYDDDPRDLWEVAEVRVWMQMVDREFPFWLYFMDLGPRSALGFVAFYLCRWEKVPGGKLIPPEDLQAFLLVHFAAMNHLAARLGEVQEEIDARSQAIVRFIFPQYDQHQWPPR